jgi:hypothetical protein
MLESLMQITNKNTDALVDMVLGFYLDGDTCDRKQIERELLDLENKHQVGLGLLLVQKLRQLAADRGL